MIHRNKHPAGRISNMIFGLCSIGDGLVRVLSFGFCHATLSLDWSRYQVKVQIKNLKMRCKS